MNMSKDHIFPYKIEEYVKHNYVLEDCWKDVTPEQFREYEKELGWHTLIVARTILENEQDRPRRLTVGIYSDITPDEDEDLNFARDRLDKPNDPSLANAKRKPAKDDNKYLRHIQY